MQQLERRFDWKNLDMVYKRLDEKTDIEIGKSGKAFFTATSTDGKTYKGSAFQSSVAQMVDVPTEHWKLELGAPNKEGKQYSIVVPCNENGTKFLRDRKAK